MSIEKQKVRDGYRYQVRYRAVDGLQKKKSFKTKQQASDFEQDQSSYLRAGGWIDPNAADMKFKLWADEWLNCNPGKRETTLARDEIIVRMHLNPQFGHLPLVAISPLDVQKLVNTWSVSYAPQTVKRQYRTLAAIFRAAVNSDRMMKSPCRGIKLPRIEATEVRLVTPEKLRELAEVLGDYALMAHLGALLGLRWGEVAGLQVRDFDLLRRTVHIRRQVSRSRKGAPLITQPKTTAAIRAISISKPMAESVARYLEIRQLTAQNGKSLLFCDSNGHPMRYSNWLKRIWHPAVESCGLVGTGFHDLRRSNATAMVAAGVDIKTAQTRLGHSDARMTLSIYAQATPAGDVDATQRLEAQFNVS